MESSSRTLVCSVLFLDIAEYSKKAVADQLQLKQAFNLVLGRALEGVAPRDRIILDTGDGAAVTFMGDPEDALFSAISVRDLSTTASQGGAPLPVRLGVNLGPVRLVKDLNGQMNIIGDGINVAQRVMSFARPGQLLVSRSFYEVVSCLSRDYLNLFRHEGSRTDKHVREHEVYSVGGTPAARRVAEAESAITGAAGVAGWIAGMGPLGLRRSSLIAAPALFAMFFGGGVAISRPAPESVPAPAAESPKTIPATPVKTVLAPVAPPPAVERPAVQHTERDVPPPAPRKALERKAALEKKIAERKAERKTEKLAAAAPAAAAAGGETGRLELAIAPWGKVIVDGQERGISPPLRVLDLSPGPHTIVVQNAGFPPHVQKVVVKPGEPTRIRHRFN